MANKKRQIHNLNESQVLFLAKHLERLGFEYDEDYTTLYADRWRIAGLEFENEKAYWVTRGLLSGINEEV